MRQILCFTLLLSCMVVAGCGVLPIASGSAQNRDVVMAFYQEALIKRQVRAGFERYMAPDFIEHKADVPAGDREATIIFLEALIKSVPDPQWQILRVAAENDLVFLHARFTPAPGAPAYAIADIFRLREGRIVEHWDIVSAPPREPRNPHSRF